MTDDTLAGLLRLILADPFDDTPRLVYADRCEDLGQFDRAAFIRAQVRIAVLEASWAGGVRKKRHAEYDRLKKLERVLPKAGKAWFPSLRLSTQHDLSWYTGVTLIATVRRGFPELLYGACAEVGLHAETLFNTYPIREVTLRGPLALDAEAFGDLTRQPDGTYRAGRWPGVAFRLPEFGVDHLADITARIQRALLEMPTGPGSRGLAAAARTIDQANQIAAASRAILDRTAIEFGLPR